MKTFSRLIAVSVLLTVAAHSVTAQSLSLVSYQEEVKTQGKEAEEVNNSKELQDVESDSHSREYKSGDNFQFLIPTGVIVPKGTHQISSFMLFFLGYNYGLSDKLQVGATAFFPINATLFAESFSVTAKYNVWKSESFSISGTGAFIPAQGYGLVMGTGTYFMSETRFHAGVGTGLSSDKDDGPGVIYSFGIDHKLSERLLLLGEFFNLGSRNYDDTESFIIAGVRFRWSEVNVDIGGFRPLGGGFGDDFLALPFVKASFAL